jgi:hypothetical protein
LTLHQKGAILPSVDETATVTSKLNQRLTGGSDHDKQRKGTGTYQYFYNRRYRESEGASGTRLYPA